MNQTTESKPVKIYILSETTAQSWLKDASTYVLALALIGPGWLMGSSAMQWLGVVVWFISVMSIPSKSRLGLTIEQARARLDEIEKERN